MSSESKTRRYRKRKRAQKEEETRRRITEAAVELHGSVGPAHTTIAEVARRAGVSRMTVYSHFPDEGELYAACSAHWSERNPLPDPAAWSEIEDPWERLAVGLEELYGWYLDKDPMMGKVMRDAPLLPPLAELMDGFWEQYLSEVINVLAPGWAAAPEGRLDVVLRLVVGHGTWRSLANSGLTAREAAKLAARMVAGVMEFRHRSTIRHTSSPTPST